MRIMLELTSEESQKVLATILVVAKEKAGVRFADTLENISRKELREMFTKAIAKAVRHLSRDYFEGEILGLVQGILKNGVHRRGRPVTRSGSCKRV
ncbi:MAG: hypothetical protein V1495_09005 [Pseudomonadota bacterium]